MAERKQVNKYYPPDFDPVKHKNINKYQNTHALRERAKKIDQGILVIRFEMPYNIWCEGCKIHIAMGVRYNAEKRKVGYYYTTPIYRFRMKCHLCDNYFEIETDPMKCDYKIIIGAQRKNQKWDMAENEQVLTEDREDVKKLATNAMFKLEHGVEDKEKLEKAAPSLSEIAEKLSGWQDDYMQNRLLRNKFRKWKKDMKEAEEADNALLTKSSLDIELVPEHEDDKKLASLLKYKAATSFDDNFKRKTDEIKNQSVFSSEKPSQQSRISLNAAKGTVTSPTRSVSSLGSPPAGEISSSIKFKFLQKQISKKQSVFGQFGEGDLVKKKRQGLAINPGIIRKKKRCAEVDRVDNVSMKRLAEGGRLDSVSMKRSELCNELEGNGYHHRVAIELLEETGKPVLGMDSVNITGEERAHDSSRLRLDFGSNATEQQTAVESGQLRSEFFSKPDLGISHPDTLREGEHVACDSSGTHGQSEASEIQQDTTTELTVHRNSDCQQSEFNPRKHDFLLKENVAATGSGRHFLVGDYDSGSSSE